PVATYFTRPMGRFLIRTVGSYLIFMLERGRVPLKLLLRLGYLVVRARDPFRKRRGAFDELYDKLLSDVSEGGRQGPILAFSAHSSRLRSAQCLHCRSEDRLRLGGGAGHAAQLP